MMELGLSLSDLKALFLAALAAWLTMAIVNNILDFPTNRFLLGKVLRMEELADEEVLGQRLLKRRLSHPAWPKIVLRLVIAAQILAAVLMWRGAWALWAWLDADQAIAAANLSIAAFMAIWVGFLTGGLYLAYWLKHPVVQQVHFNLLILSFAAAILINLN